MTPEIEQLKCELANLGARISMAEAQIAVIDDDIPEPDLMSNEGGGGGSSGYTSYFRVIDASEWSTATPPALIACKIGVTNGSAEIADPPVSWCGACKVSGVLANALLTGDLENKVPAVPNSGAGSISACSGEIAAEGEYYVWLHSWIGHDGVWCEVRIGDVDDSNPPNNPNGGIGWASQLLGRVTVEDIGGDLTITNITQDYLRGGEHAEDVVGDCEGLELQEPTP